MQQAIPSPSGPLNVLCKHVDGFTKLIGNNIYSDRPNSIMLRVLVGCRRIHVHMYAHACTCMQFRLRGLHGHARVATDFTERGTFLLLF